MMLYLLDLFGVAVFAVSGALTAGRKNLDIFGVLVIAVVTAIGGGTIRDLLLGNRPIFWIEDITYLLVILAAAVATLLYGRFREPPQNSLLVADAFGLAVFTVVGTRTAAEAGNPGLIVIFMGVITGVGGGVLRDVVCAEIPLIIRREIYATASIAGAAVYVVLNGLIQKSPIVILAPIAIVFALRLAAIRFDLHMPPFTLKDEEP
jgi:uncharacterized membrane protein YeiH